MPFPRARDTGLTETSLAHLSRSWAVMNLGFFVCVECAGVHRGLGVQYSQVRSTELDVGCWDEKVFQYFAAKGNAAARQKYAHDVPRFVLTPRECKTSLVRRNWISKKYREMVYLNRGGAGPSRVVRMPERAHIGWLNKQNENGKWQRRFTVLHRGELCYFKDATISYPKGTIPLAGVRVDLPRRDLHNRDPKAPPFDKYKFSVHTSGREYVFAPDNEELVFEWIHALRRAAIFYAESKQVAKPAKCDDQRCSYGSLKSDIAYEGVLSKQGGRFQSWNKRRCVVAGGVLYYFKSQRPKPKDMSAGSIPLSICDVGEADRKVPTARCLAIHPRYRA